MSAEYRNAADQVLKQVERGLSQMQTGLDQLKSKLRDDSGLSLYDRVEVERAIVVTETVVDAMRDGIMFARQKLASLSQAEAAQ